MGLTEEEYEIIQAISALISTVTIEDEDVRGGEIKRRDLINNLNKQREILKSQYQNPNVDVEELKSSLFSALYISGSAIEVLQEELDEEAE